ncbi:hypothetical protein C7964_102382 [Loktanella sp. PT4BL]|jgi:hypothetical protein|uniref:hypothetical protein n=1 Tax=Loktanella sp. PT4BL TaxID=2135611 RepID=UPI000D753CB2|nr:hypothetical protein [Loktanella sp. PT4BL]PXW70492.1 hypothetical protein C7964_102382 [Loktanella sp. PT4BL]
MLNLDKAPLIARRRHTEGLTRRLTKLCLDAAPHIKEALEPFAEYWGEADVEIFIGDKPKATLRASFRHKTCRGDRAAFEATVRLGTDNRVDVEAYAMGWTRFGSIKRGAVDQDPTGRSVANAYLTALKPRIEAAFEAVVLGEEERLPSILID